MTDARHTAVCTLLREVAAATVLPRFRHLDAADIEEKAKDDLVTIADREAEVELARGLAGIDPEARIVGEEACACLLYTSPSPRDATLSRMPSSA